jgi:uncharacterized protein (DUF1697 family)
METFIAILRGINVSGHKKMEMAGLKALFEKLRFKNVSTYIQSGNVIFNAAKVSADKHVKTIEQAISGEYGFEVPVIIRTLEEWKKIIAANPFLTEADIDVEKLHVIFLDHVAEKDKIDTIESLKYSPDRCKVIGKEVYLCCPAGYGNTKLTNTFFEKNLKATATTRNWKTVNKLLALAGSY